MFGLGDEITMAGKMFSSQAAMMTFGCSPLARISW